MSMELKSQINKAEQEKDIKTLEEIQENAEIGFEGEIAGLAKAALDRLHGKVEDAEKTPDHVVEKLSEEKVEEITAEVDKEIEGLKERVEGEIEGVVGNGVLSPEVLEQINSLQKTLEFLKEQEISRKKYHDKLEEEISGGKIYDFSNSEKDYRYKQISEVHYEYSVTIPKKIRETEEKIKALTSPEIENIPTMEPIQSDVEKLSIDQKIAKVDSLNALHNLLKQEVGIQGSSEFYSADDLLERVRGYVNGTQPLHIITRSGGLREKVKELKEKREKELKK
jgi:hypothetical protein